MAIIANLSILMTADVQKAEQNIKGVANSIVMASGSAARSSGQMAVYGNSMDLVRDRASLAKEGIGFFGNAVSLVNPQLGNAINHIERMTKDIGQLTDVAKAGGAGMMIFKAGVVAAVAALSVKIVVSITDWIAGVEKFNKALTDSLEKAASQTEKTNQKVKQAYEDRIELINLTTSGQERINALVKEEASLRKTLADNDRDIQAAQNRLAKTQLPSVGKSIYKFFGGGATSDEVAAQAALENAQKIFKANRDALVEIDKAKNPVKSNLDKARELQKLKEEGLALAKTLQSPFEQFQESTKRIIDLAKAGAIDAETARRAVSNEAKKTQSAFTTSPINVGAVTRGTAAALSPFLRRTESNPVQQQVLAAQREANKTLDAINKKLKPNSIIFTPVSF